jgi:hypothetical protein
VLLVLLVRLVRLVPTVPPVLMKRLEQPELRASRREVTRLWRAV